MSTLLRVCDVTTGFGAVTVLHDLSFEVPEGSLTAILGLNGAGKSVTMKTVAGLIPAWEGTVAFDGQDITDLSPRERVAAGMSHVTQGRQVFPELTVEENLRIGAYVLRKRDRARYPAVLSSVYERFPKLAERRDQPAGTMSGGEQAMLAVGRALMNEPRLLLVDEPSAGLAPSIVEELLELLRGVAASGVTILMVEQNIAFALDVADRALIMQRGHIVYGGDVEGLERDALTRYLGIGRLLTNRVPGAAAASPAPTPSRPDGGQGRRLATKRLAQRRARLGGPMLAEVAPTKGDLEIDRLHKGGGWYELPDGSTVRGRDAALAAVRAASERAGA